MLTMDFIREVNEENFHVNIVPSKKYLQIHSKKKKKKKGKKVAAKEPVAAVWFAAFVHCNSTYAAKKGEVLSYNIEKLRGFTAKWVFIFVPALSLNINPNNFLKPKS